MELALHPQCERICEKYSRLVGEKWKVGESYDDELPRDEKILQAQFYGGEFGDTWVTDCGRKVRVLSPGVWNLEAGPDFRDAVVSFDEDKTVRGDIEIDIDAKAWEAHGHHANPNFEDVILHFYVHSHGPQFFARTLSNRFVPQAKLEIVQTKNSKNFKLLGQTPLEDTSLAHRLIRQAALFRLVAKAKKFAFRVRFHGPILALYQSIAEGLGYKHNSLPMLLLAQRTMSLPRDEIEAEAKIFGVAGFLDNNIQIQDSSQSYLSKLWSYWWKIRDEHQRLILPRSVWKISNLRPQNHPQRRIGALCSVRSVLSELWKALEGSKKDKFVELLKRLKHPFWNFHWTFHSAPLTKPVALIGHNRCIDLLINYFYPAQLSLGAEPEGILDELFMIQLSVIPRKIRETRDWLCKGIEDKILRNSLYQQGLLQIATDLRGKVNPTGLTMAGI